MLFWRVVGLLICFDGLVDVLVFVSRCCVFDFGILCCMSKDFHGSCVVVPRIISSELSILLIIAWWFIMRQRSNLISLISSKASGIWCFWTRTSRVPRIGSWT
jgi:hypothetical protein